MHFKRMCLTIGTLDLTFKYLSYKAFRSLPNRTHCQSLWQWMLPRVSIYLILVFYFSGRYFFMLLPFGYPLRVPTPGSPVSLYASDAAGFVHVMHVTLGSAAEPVARWRAHEFECWCVASADSCDRCETILLSTSRSTGRRYDTIDAYLLLMFPIPFVSSSVGRVCRCESARLGSAALLASGGDDAKLRLWDLRTLPAGPGPTSGSASANSKISRAAHTLSAHNSGVTSLAWHPTRAHLLASGR